MPKRELYAKAVAKWGVDSQLDMLVEECSELIQAVQKMKRYERWKQGHPRELSDSLCEELADVSIMVEQVSTIMGSAVVEVCRRKALDRLEKMVNEEPAI